MKSRQEIQKALLSTDFYLRECGNVKCKNILDFKKLAFGYSSMNNVVKIFLDSVLAIDIFSDWNLMAPSDSVEIYIHKGDRIPSENLFEKMNSFGFKLFSVNWMGNLDICKPIPIGIPPKTFSRLHGEVIFDSIHNFTDNDKLDRKHHFYVNFDITTNIIERKSALLAFLPRADAFIPNRRLSVREHLKSIKESKYVISPPGAGLDCYRTWEAIYLGAIPVVLKNNWPFRHLDLPVRIVDSYSDFLDEVNEGHEQEIPNITREFILDLPKKFR